MKQTSYRLCGQLITWIESAQGRPVPCDPKVITVVTDEGKVVRGRISHFATCPDYERKKTDA